MNYCSDYGTKMRRGVPHCAHYGSWLDTGADDRYLITASYSRNLALVYLVIMIPRLRRKHSSL